MNQKTAIVVGAGIVGLALARALAVRGNRVSVFERHERATGASVRNAGLISLVGVPNGVHYERAQVSRAVWREFCEAAQVWHEATGSLHAAYADDEMAVIEQYAAANAGTRPCAVFTPAQARERSPGIVPHGLAGALWSADEMVLDPRVAVRALPSWLAERYGVEFRWKQAVTRIEYPAVWSGGRRYLADRIYVANGTDFELLYPALLERLPIDRRRWQLLRFDAQPDGFRPGPVLFGGLSMVQGAGFRTTPGMAALRERYRRDHAALLARGVQVMAVQNGRGEILFGESYDDGHADEPFDAAPVRQQAIDYLRCFADVPHGPVAQASQGIDARLSGDDTELVIEPEPGVTIVNGVQSGMTLAFGLAEEIVAGRYHATRTLAA